MNIIEWFWNDGELLMIMGVGIIIVGIILKKKKNKK
jgi:LPXTG-motif cell wall-anchored protein|tara:strand:+ start:16 stop:123 length:108 start_codon:yes stop_codon:yes gene_type:complete